MRLRHSLPGEHQSRLALESCLPRVSRATPFLLVRRSTTNIHPPHNSKTEQATETTAPATKQDAGQPYSAPPPGLLEGQVAPFPPGITGWEKQEGPSPPSGPSLRQAGSRHAAGPGQPGLRPSGRKDSRTPRPRPTASGAGVAMTGMIHRGRSEALAGCSSVTADHGVG